MTHTLIEIAYNNTEDELLLDAHKPTYDEIKQHLRAVQHNMNKGPASTLYHVSDDVDRDKLQELLNSSSNVKEWGLVEGVKRGLEIQPGTATTQEIDTYRKELQDKLGEDVLAQQPKHTPMNHPYSDLPDDHIGDSAPSWAGPETEPGAGGLGQTTDGNGPPEKSFYEIMDHDMPSIGEGKWVDLHPDLSSPEVLDIGEESSIGNTRKDKYSSANRRPFDVGGFL